MVQENPPIPNPDLKEKAVEDFLRAIEENLLIDDHGQAIIGERKRKPKWPE